MSNFQNLKQRQSHLIVAVSFVYCDLQFVLFGICYLIFWISGLPRWIFDLSHGACPGQVPGDNLLLLQ